MNKKLHCPGVEQQIFLRWAHAFLFQTSNEVTKERGSCRCRDIKSHRCPVFSFHVTHEFPRDPVVPNLRRYDWTLQTYRMVYLISKPLDHSLGPSDAGIHQWCRMEASGSIWCFSKPYYLRCTWCFLETRCQGMFDGTTGTPRLHSFRRRHGSGCLAI